MGKDLVTRAAAQKLARARERLQPADQEQATESARLLVKSYPRDQVPDPDVYARMLTMAFMKYPADVHLAAIDRLTDRLKFAPTKADIVEACDELMAPLRRDVVEARHWLEREQDRAAAPSPEERQEALDWLEQWRKENPVPEAEIEEPPARQPILVPLSDEEREATLQRLEGIREREVADV